MENLSKKDISFRLDKIKNKASEIFFQNLIGMSLIIVIPLLKICA